jgi:hypothetical protein
VQQFQRLITLVFVTLGPTALAQKKRSCEIVKAYLDTVPVDLQMRLQVPPARTYKLHPRNRIIAHG